MHMFVRFPNCFTYSNGIQIGKLYNLKVLAEKLLSVG